MPPSAARGFRAIWALSVYHEQRPDGLRCRCRPTLPHVSASDHCPATVDVLRAFPTSRPFVARLRSHPQSRPRELLRLPRHSRSSRSRPARSWSSTMSTPGWSSTMSPPGWSSTMSPPGWSSVSAPLDRVLRGRAAGPEYGGRRKERGHGDSDQRVHERPGARSWLPARIAGHAPGPRGCD
jgi:hypothetical protein